jgi:amino acid transporter
MGYDFITTLSYEAKNPRRDIPVSIQACVGICTLTYITIAFSLSGVAKLYEFTPATAVA